MLPGSMAPLPSPDEDESVAQLEMALARALYLMSRIATVGACNGRMQNLLGQLQQVMNHAATPASLRESCAALHEQWQILYQQRLEAQASQGLGASRKLQ